MNEANRLFLGLVLMMASVVIGLLSRYLSGRARATALGVFLLWMLYVGVMGYTGVIASAKLPGPALLVVPAMLFIALFLTRHPGVRAFALSMPTWLLIGLQGFRVCVELGLHDLYQRGLVPRMLTFEGANLDILIGLSAPIVAWLYAAGKMDRRTVRLWNWLGITMLTNVFVRAFLTFPGPLNLLHTEVANRAMGIFPFTFLPGFLAPLALCLHVLVLRSVPKESLSRGQAHSVPGV